jgi:hypothetical protein
MAISQNRKTTGLPTIWVNQSSFSTVVKSVDMPCETQTSEKPVPAQRQFILG